MGLDTVEIVFTVEERFSICIPNEVAARLVTVGQLHQFVVDELERKGARGVDRDEVYSTIRHIVCRVLGVKPEHVVPTARFVQDLGAD